LDVVVKESRGNPENVVALVPYLVASALAPAEVVSVSADRTTNIPKMNPEKWAEGVRFYLQLRYWVPEVKEDTSSLEALKQGGVDFENSMRPIISQGLAKTAVARYISLVSLLNNFIHSDVQAVFADDLLRNSHVDLVGTSRPALFDKIDIFSNADSLKNRPVGTMQQLGLAKEVDAVRGVGKWILAQQRGRRHGQASEVFNGCLSMDISAKLIEGSAQIGPRSISFCQDQAPLPIPGHENVPCQGRGHGLNCEQTDRLYRLFFASSYGFKTWHDAESRAELNWLQLMSIFRAASDWTTWEATLPASNGYTSADVNGFFTLAGTQIHDALKKYQSRLAMFIAQKDRTFPDGATPAEKPVIERLRNIIDEINRAYVSAVGLLVLSYGECLPYAGFDDWPQTGPYRLTSGGVMKAALASGVLPIEPILNATNFPVLFSDRQAAKCRGFPASITKGMDWLSGYEALNMR
jgi:hypothetical protein